MLRAYPCPNLRRWASAHGTLVRPSSYNCVPCLFTPVMTKAAADMAVSRSTVRLEAYPCRNNLGWHTRVLDPL